MSIDATKDTKENMLTKLNGREMSISTQSTVIAPLLPPQGLQNLKVQDAC
jgi:hypothetical protein